MQIFEKTIQLIVKNTSFIARAIYNVQKNVIKTTQIQHFVWSIARKKLTLHRKKGSQYESARQIQRTNKVDKIES